MYVSQIIMLYTLNLYSAVFNYISIKLEGKKKERNCGEKEALSLNILWLDVTTGIQFLQVVAFCVTVPQTLSEFGQFWGPRTLNTLELQSSHYVGIHLWPSVDISGMKVKVVQSCPTLCDLTDCSPPGTPVHEIFQARILEWVAISSSRK